MALETRSIFIVEDHPKMRQLLRQLIEGVAGLAVVGEASSAEAALAQLAKLEPDLIMVDLSLPGMSGLDLVRWLHEQQPGLRCLVVTAHNEPRYQAAALAAGAAGYVTKDDPDAVLDAVHEVLQQ